MTSEQKPGTKVAEKIARGILNFQNAFSARMNRLKSLKAILISFCFISGSLSIYFLVDAIVSKPKPKQKIKIDQIRTPKPAYEPSEEMYDERIPDEVYYDIQAYKRYMDSTGETIRPGLADSMKYLEEIYLQQQNK